MTNYRNITGQKHKGHAIMAVYTKQDDEARLLSKWLSFLACIKEAGWLETTKMTNTKIIIDTLEPFRDRFLSSNKTFQDELASEVYFDRDICSMVFDTSNGKYNPKLYQHIDSQFNRDLVARIHDLVDRGFIKKSMVVLKSYGDNSLFYAMDKLYYSYKVTFEIKPHDIN
jgi:hypothetical protein